MILAIESSCDETSAAVVSNGKLLSNIVRTQVIHSQYGGVVPELSAREHIEYIDSIVDKALSEANITINDIKAIGVTIGPGLIPALHVGVSYAKGLAWSRNLPLIPVNHLEGHIFSILLSNDVEPPVLLLLVSGGHTILIDMPAWREYKILGSTRDDACGEAFDKVAKMLNLGYPGGPHVEKLAQGGKNLNIIPVGVHDNSCDFSFSGMKSAVGRVIADYSKKEDNDNWKADVASSFMHSAIKQLTNKIGTGLEKTGYNKVAIVGGVSANKHLRTEMERLFGDYDVYFADLKYSSDNAAMIGIVADHIYRNESISEYYNYSLEPKSKLPLQSVKSE